METSVKQRLEQFIKFKNLSANKFEKLCGLSVRYIANLKKSPSPEIIKKILLTFPELNRIWLLTGEGDMVVAHLAGDPPAGIPVFEDANFGCSPTGFDGALTTPDCYISVPELAADGRTLVVRARGDSMVNAADPTISIPNGAYVAIQKANLTTPMWGEVYALSTDDGCIIKRLYPSERAGFVKCVSYNQEYPPFELRADEIHDLAIVKAVVTVSLR